MDVLDYRWLGHLAYVLIAASYLVRDMLWLRALAIVASLLGIAFGFFLPEGGTPIIFWNVLFTLINAYRIGVMLREKMDVKFTPEEFALYDVLFRQALSPVDYMRLLRISQWRTAGPGEELVREGEPVLLLMVISEGAVTVHAGGEEVARVNEGKFIGEMSFTTGRPASATVVTAAPTRLLVWRQDSLHRLLTKHEPVRNALHLLLGTDMALKLGTRPREKQGRNGG